MEESPGLSCIIGGGRALCHDEEQRLTSKPDLPLCFTMRGTGYNTKGGAPALALLIARCPSSLCRTCGGGGAASRQAKAPGPTAARPPCNRQTVAGALGSYDVLVLHGGLYDGIRQWVR